MKKDEFLDKMENLNLPEMENTSHQKQFKVYLLNTRKSALLGLMLLLLPFFFVLSNVLEYVLKVRPGFIRKVVDLFVYFDTIPGLWFLGPLLILGGPLVAVILNLLSVLHFHYARPSKELTVTLKLKWLNLAIILICTLILVILVLYLIVENVVPH